MLKHTEQTFWAVPQEKLIPRVESIYRPTIRTTSTFSNISLILEIWVFFVLFPFLVNPVNVNLTSCHPSVTLDKPLSKRNGTSYPSSSSSLPLYDLTLPITITVRSPQSHVCWHAQAHTHAHITGSVFSRFQAGMRYFLKQHSKAELPCLFDCKNMPSPSPRCDSPLLPFCEGRKQNKRHLLPGSTLSTLGPLHNPRKGFKFAARARCDTLKRRGKKRKTKISG